MRTGELIRALVTDRPAPRIPPGRMLMLALTAGFVISALAFAIGLGPRADIAHAVTSLRFLFKPVLMLSLAAASGWLLLRLIQPGVPARPLALVAIPAVLAGAVTVELIDLPQSQWTGALIGDNWYKCISVIPLLSLPLAAALVPVLRHGAPTRPAVAGAVAGLTAAGLAAALYALNCTDDSPLFVAVWYSLAVAIVSLAGAFAGRTAWRW